MPYYKYQAKDENGKIVHGTLSAESAMAAATTLRRDGGRVMSMSPVKTRISKKQVKEVFKALNYSSGPSQKDVLDFTTQLAAKDRSSLSG